MHLSQVGNYIIMAGTDHGLGIKKEDQKRIFERFFLVGRLQKKFPGMVIGLYVYEQISKNNKGLLRVESEEGDRRYFEFYITPKN